MIRRMAQSAQTRTNTVVGVAPRSIMRVAVTAGVAIAVAIAVATVCLAALGRVTGADRPVDRLFSAVHQGHHLNTTELIVALGVGLALLALVGAVLVGALAALFANHVLPLTGGLRIEEEDPAPRKQGHSSQGTRKPRLPGLGSERRG